MRPRDPAKPLVAAHSNWWHPHHPQRSGTSSVSPDGFGGPGRLAEKLRHCHLRLDGVRNEANLVSFMMQVIQLRRFWSFAYPFDLGM